MKGKREEEEEVGEPPDCDAMWYHVLFQTCPQAITLGQGQCLSVSKPRPTPTKRLAYQHS